MVSNAVDKHATAPGQFSGVDNFTVST